ncbi:MAG TPA: GGDEF domain-containing protein [Anaerolineales bacterium]|nr:GGDEF domain-containing protein [Anaerolineales bacterium]
MENEDFYKKLLDNLSDGVYFVDRDRVITYWNKGAERISGYDAAQVIGRSCRDNILNHVTENGVQLCLTNCPLASTMADGMPREAEVYLHHSQGYRLPVTVRASPIFDNEGKIIGAVEAFSNNSKLADSRRQIYKLRKAALLDPLTEVANRRFLNIRLHTMLKEYQESNLPFGVMMCDIDGFKSVNDTLGHAVGDRVLGMVARTFQAVLRYTDMVGRWGGDEMVCVFPEVNQAGLLALSEKLRHMVATARLDLENTSVSVKISCGCTMVNEKDSVESIIKRADALMYKSKFSGGNRVTSDDVQ